MTRIGILGGTFDPIHEGHLEAATAARRALKLDEVLLMPSRTPPHRSTQPHASPFHRFAMIALAVADRDGLVSSDDELSRAGLSYTSDTLARLHAKGFDPTQLFFVLGADAFNDISTWHQYPALLDAAHFVVVSRGEASIDDVRARRPELGSRLVDVPSLEERSNGSPRVVLLPATTPNVSSTEIRRRVAAGQPLAGLTPRAVINHIERHGLYKVSVVS